MIFTVGHSTLTPEEYLKTLALGEVSAVIDVRSHPGSSHVPVFGRAEMQKWLSAAHIDYEWCPDLGGWADRDAPLADSFRRYGVDVEVYTHGAFPKARIAKKIRDNINPRCPQHGGVRQDGECTCDQRQNPIWQNYGFYDYSFYMMLPRFTQAARQLAERGQHQNVAIMCAEILPWRALEINTPVLTPTGWKAMGELHVGDHVIGSDGYATKVVAIPFRGTAPLYDIKLADSTTIRCSGDHQWAVEAFSGGVRKRWILSTADMHSRNRKTRNRWAIPATPPVQYQQADELPVHPYLFGVLLGDGGFYAGPNPNISRGSGGSTPRWTSNTTDGNCMAVIITPLTSDSIQRRPHHDSANASVYMLIGNNTRNALKAIGIWGTTDLDKYIPDLYLKASVTDRWHLLRGLMDTDGHVSADGNTVKFYNSAPALIEGVAELVRSLGGTARIWSRDRQEPNTHRAYSISIRTPGCPFWLPRKIVRWRLSRHRFSRRIVSITPTERGECQCITVSADDGLFITAGFTLTHNCHRAMIADYLGFIGTPVQHLQPKLTQHDAQSRLDRYAPKILTVWQSDQIN